MITNCSVILLNAFPDKKIKSLGNKYLLKISDKNNILDYQIKTLNKFIKNPEIIIVGGFDGKRLKKYIDTKYKSKIKYIEHDIDVKTNIGKSICEAYKVVSQENCLIINSSIILQKQAIDIIKTTEKKSFLMVSGAKSQIGYISNGSELIRCYYDLPNSIIEALFLSKKDKEKTNKIINSGIDNMFLFEIINLFIENKLIISPLKVPSKSILTIDSVNNINKLINQKIC